MPTFVFAGGGTGGHIYPAMAIAEHLPQGSITRYLCSPRPIDARILTAERARFDIVPAHSFGLRPRTLVRFLGAWGPAVRRARELLRECARSDRVELIAMGGFVAAPVAQAARAERLPVTLVNLDAVPGKANRWIARHADRIFDAAASDTWPDAIRTAPIVRRAAIADADPADCRAALGLAPDMPTLFVTGGSQGAESMNALLRALLTGRRRLFEGWQVFHQAGSHDEASLQRAYDDAGVPARVVDFCTRMAIAWGAADFAIARAGAATVGEIWANHVPALFLPYPFHQDQHQRKNAEPLVESGGAVLCIDRVDPDKTAIDATPILESVLRDESRRATMRRALTALGPADGARTIARHLTGPMTDRPTH